MAYDQQTGQWYYDPSDMDDAAEFQEHAQKRAKEATFDQGLRINQQTQQTQYIINDEMQRACEELGITQSEFNALGLGPQEQEAALRRGTRKYVKKAFQKSKKATGPQKASQPGRQRQPAQQSRESKPASLQEGREKVERGGHLNESEQMDILAAVLGPDFKV